MSQNFDSLIERDFCGAVESGETAKPVDWCHYHNGPFKEECPLGGKCERKEDWGKTKPSPSPVEEVGDALMAVKVINPHPGVWSPDPELVARMQQLEDRIKELDGPALSREDAIAAARADILAKLPQPVTGPAELPRSLSLKIRNQLWLTHGCGLHFLYGDDGEMSCNRMPFIDFRRGSEDEILKGIDAHNLLRIAETQKDELSARVPAVASEVELPESLVGQDWIERMLVECPGEWNTANAARELQQWRKWASSKG